MLFGVILLFINAKDHSNVFILRRGGNEHLLGTTLQVSRRLGGIGK